MWIELPSVPRIIPAMRHWLLIFMIALLPLRGWTAGTMAGQMPVAHAAAAAISMEVSAEMTMDMPVDMTDCPGHVEAGAESADSTGPGDSHASGNCHTCASCQICHTVAATVSAALPAFTFPHHALPSSGSARFASAQPAQGLKPPIS